MDRSVILDIDLTELKARTKLKNIYKIIRIGLKPKGGMPNSHTIEDVKCSFTT